jgi:hypothetical protein
MAQTYEEELKGTINNEHQFHAIRLKYGISTNNGIFVINGATYEKSWWACREDERVKHGIYVPTVPLKQLNNLLPLYSHVSLLDPKKVAHTPDKSFGERDAQLVISIGKLLTRFYPALRDEAIQTLVSAHESEISTEVEFIEHGDIAASYRLFGSNGACMSKDLSDLGGNNPAIAYDVPGVRLAVLRNSAGEISSRSLIWEKSDTDKIYIRCYPARAVLQTRLERLGYNAGNWNGMKFNTVKHQDYAEDYPRYIFPYLDGNGSVGSTSASCVALLDGVITGVDHNKYTKISRNFANTTVCATTTSGTVSLRNLTTEDCSLKDFITGETFSAFDEQYDLRYQGVDYVTQLNPLDYGWIYAYTVKEGSNVGVYMKVEETFTVSRGTFDLYFIAQLGYVKLDAELYGTSDTAIIREHQSRMTLSGKLISSDDAINILDSDGVEGKIHKSEIVTTGKNKHVKFTKDWYCMPDTKLYYTPSGRKVHPNVHDVKLTWDGTYDFSRNVKSFYVLSEQYWISKDFENSGLEREGSPLWNKRVEEVLDEARDSVNYVSNSGPSKLASRVYDRLRQNTYRGYKGLHYQERITLSFTEPIEQQMQIIREIDGYLLEATSRIARVAAEVMYAEMCAVEAPAMYVSPPQELVGPVRPLTVIPMVVEELSQETPSFIGNLNSYITDATPLRAYSIGINSITMPSTISLISAA